MIESKHPLGNPAKYNGRRINNRSVFIRGGSIGNCALLDSILDLWVHNNEKNSCKGVIVVDSLFGYTWGIYPGNDKGVQEIRGDLWGFKLFKIFDDGRNLHIILWNKGRCPQSKGHIIIAWMTSKSMNSVDVNYTGAGADHPQ